MLEAIEAVKSSSSVSPVGLWAETVVKAVLKPLFIVNGLYITYLNNF